MLTGSAAPKVTVTHEITVSPPKVEVTEVPVYPLTCGEDIIAGEAVCQSSTEEEKCYKADANDSNKMPVIGIAKQSGTTGNSIDVYYGGLVRDVKRTGDFNVKDVIYMSNTPGQVTKDPPIAGGSGQQKLGVATSSDDILLDIDLTVMWLP